MRLDSHQHFWRYNPDEYTWMTEQMGALKRDFLPQDLRPLLETFDFDGCIAVQARQNLEETHWLLELAERYDFIKGVVGWIDLCSTARRSQLEKYGRHPKLVGVRHVLHDESDDLFMLRMDFKNGISQLQEYGLTYDLLIYPKHLPTAAKLVAEFPAQRFVLDHIAKPSIGKKFVSAWQSDLIVLANSPGVFCKLSGMVTEAKWNQWQQADFQRFLDIVFDAFGPERLMIGSDWPVCTLSGEYEPTIRIVTDYLRQFPADVQDKILGGNCARFYGIS